jgi:hypothetical protein
VFEIARTDTKVSWWTGSSTFLGTEPPARLTAWPELRRVHIDKTPRPLLDLPAVGGHVTSDRFAEALQAFLRKTPLTDLATCRRAAPELRFTDEALGLVASRAGRTLALRALSGQPEEAVDQALGRATQLLIGPQPTPQLLAALSLLAERAIAGALRLLGADRGGWKPHLQPQAAFAQGVGAYAAMVFVGLHGETFTAAERSSLLALLRPAVEMPSVAPVAQLLDAALSKNTALSGATTSSSARADPSAVPG